MTVVAVARFDANTTSAAMHEALRPTRRMARNTRELREDGHGEGLILFLLVGCRCAQRFCAQCTIPVHTETRDLLKFRDAAGHDQRQGWPRQLALHRTLTSTAVVDRERPGEDN